MIEDGGQRMVRKCAWAVQVNVHMWMTIGVCACAHARKTESMPRGIGGSSISFRLTPRDCPLVPTNHLLHCIPSI